MSEHNKSLVRRIIEEVWSQGKLDVLDEIIHPDANTPHGPWELPGGPEGFKYLVSIIRTAFPDLTRKVEDIVVEGDKVVLRSTFTGTHTGASDFAPFPPTGERWKMFGVTAFKFVAAGYSTSPGRTTTSPHSWVGWLRRRPVATLMRP